MKKVKPARKENSTKRKTRELRQTEFLHRQDLAWTSMSQDLYQSALVLLSRETHFGRDPNADGEPHGTHAPAAIVLLCTAFDQWLTEECLALDVCYEGLRECAAMKSAVVRFREMWRIFSGSEAPQEPDLEAALEVRNEIVHLLPRRTLEKASWPVWLKNLQDRGLVLRSPNPDGSDSIDLVTKLHSYPLAIWVCETLNSAASRLVEAFPPDRQSHRESVAHGAANFALFKLLPRPRPES